MPRSRSSPQALSGVSGPRRRLGISPALRPVLVAALLFSGLAVALAAAAAVMVQPALLADLRPYWPPIAIASLISTAAGLYWLYWRPR